MDNCSLKWILISFCLLIAVIGLYLAFIREKRNITQGHSDTQSGGANLKDGTFNFNFAIGLVLILIGLGGAIYCSIKLPGCDKKIILPPITDSSNTVTDTSSITRDSVLITVNKSKNYTVSGLVRGEQNMIRLRGNYRYYAQGAYQVTINLNVYANGSKIETFPIDVDPDKDLFLDKTFFIDKAESDNLNLSFTITAPGWTLTKGAYIDFKGGLNITVAH